MRVKLEHLSVMAFIIVAYILLPMMNGDYLFTIQDNSIFIGGHTFMLDTVSDKHGGWIAWLSCYLTQFFYHPWLGSTILIAFWVATYFLLIHTFHVKGKWRIVAWGPPTFFLFWILDYGYWIYYTKTIGYVFNHPLLFFVVVLCSFQLTWTLRKVVRIKLLSSYVIPCFSFTLCLIIGSFLLGGWRIDDHQSEILITLGNKNFKHEMRMYRAIDESRYEDALAEMKDMKEQPTNLMVLFKNIALMHTDRLTDMFKTDNRGIVPATGDSLHLRISQLAAPLVYYQFGQMNYSYRWAMGNSIKYGQSFRNLKMMARCAIFNQEFDVAMKYLAMLKSSIYYKGWAREREAWLTSSTPFIQSREYQAIGPLINDDVNSLDNDNGLCEKYILDHFSDLITPTSPKLEDVIMCLSLWSEDEYAFCIHFYDYVQRHPNEPIPELYQEGAILLGTAESSPITLDRFRFDTTVSEKYNHFAQDYNQLSQQGVSESEMASRLQPLYGDTYWWYYYFYTDFQIY